MKLFEMFSKKKPKGDPFSIMDARILFVKPDCPHCRKWLGAVELVNTQLEPENRIQKVFTTDMDTRNSMTKVTGTPTLLINGILVEGMTTSGFAESFLKGFLKNMGELA